jgi:aspartate carbamoyltransferase catalytic subunit
MSHFRTKLFFIAPEALQIPKYYLEELDSKKVPYSVETGLGIAKDLDIIYMTRIQKERFPDPLEYQKLKGVFQIDKTILNNTKKDVRIMHPLPRVDEISKDLDDTPQAAYIRQAGNGIPIRQAILALVTGALDA